MAAIDQAITDRYALYLGDSCEVMPTFPANQVHLSVYSPPFAGLYHYSSSERDLSNCRSYEEFFEHYGFVVEQIARDLKASIVYALDHRAPALAHARQFNRGIGDERTDTFVGMYVNQWTVDYGPRGRQAVQALLDRAWEAELIPEPIEVQFVG